MHPKFEMMEPTTRFGKWLYSKMIEREITCSDVARKLRVTRQTVAFHTSGHNLPNYPFVIAYCSILGDDPEYVWKLVILDKGWS